MLLNFNVKNPNLLIGNKKTTKIFFFLFFLKKVIKTHIQNFKCIKFGIFIIIVVVFVVLYCHILFYKQIVVFKTKLFLDMINLGILKEF